MRGKYSVQPQHRICPQNNQRRRQIPRAGRGDKQGRPAASGAFSGGEFHFKVATCGTIRFKLLKIDGRVIVSVRRIKTPMASAFPYQAAFVLARLLLCAPPI